MGNGASSSYTPSTSHVRTPQRRPPTPPPPDGPADTPIHRQALGRIAKLGDLYDATNDKFCKISVFRQPLSDDSPTISKANNSYSETRFSNVSSLEEKFRELKVTGELQLSVLVGMCELGGSAEYLKQKRNSFGTVTSTQLCHIKTVTDRLEVSHDQVKNNISEEAMRHRRATHVVIEIEWGANCVMTAREQKRIIENKRKAEGKIAIVVSHIRDFGRQIVGLGNTKEETEERIETSVEILGDVLPDELPQTVDDAKVMMANIPQLVKNCNDGKGKPLTYVMIPIWDLDRLVSRRPSQSTRTFVGVDDARTMKIVRLFDRMTELRQKIQDTLNQSEVGARLEDHEATAKCELCELLENVRSGKEGMECLDAFCDKHHKKADEIFHIITGCTVVQHCSKGD